MAFPYPSSQIKGHFTALYRTQLDRWSPETALRALSGHEFRRTLPHFGDEFDIDRLVGARVVEMASG